MSLEDEAKKILVEWLEKRGHDQCWYYPDIFERLATLFGIVCSKPELPSLCEFQEGCRRFQLTLFKEPKMDPILLIALIGKGLLEGLTLVQKLQEQHAQGQEITKEQAENLRNVVKASQSAAEAEWEKA